MLYLIPNKINHIVTDSTLTFIPEKVDVTLDDVLLGEYTNLSTKQRYLELDIPINAFKENKEYTLKLYVGGDLIKTELSVVSKQDNINFLTITNSKKTIIQYER